MSLINFHIFLISTATIFGFWFGSWEFAAFSHSKSYIDLAAAIGSTAASFALAIYLIWFVKKKKPMLKD